MAEPALGSDPTAVPFHDALRDIEPQPHPTPIVADLHEALEHGLQPVGRNSRTPVSRTAKHRSGPTRSTWTTMRPPRGVNLTALLRRLMSAWKIRAESRGTRGTGWTISAPSETPLADACG